MPDILPILLTLSPVLPTTTCRQLHRIVLAMLSMTGRVTQLGLSRWAGKRGSYRTFHRCFHTPMDWLAVQWCFFQLTVDYKNAVYILFTFRDAKQYFGLEDFLAEILKFVPEKPDTITCAELIEHVCRRMFIHPKQTANVNSNVQPDSAVSGETNRIACQITGM